MRGTDTPHLQAQHLFTTYAHVASGAGACVSMGLGTGH